MNEQARRVDTGALVGGVILIGLGILFFLDRFHFADFRDLIGTYWPLIIVMVGLPKLFAPGTIWAGLWLITIGLWLQAVRLHLWELTFRNSWPLLLIVLGGGIVLRTFVEGFTRRPPADMEGEDHGR